jgi:hypothetical protein
MGEEGRMPSESRSIWWVNQGQSYSRDLKGGYLWAPKRNKDGHTFVHWTNLTRLRPGDVVIHYANGAIRATSTVTSPARDAPRPYREANSAWEKDGLQVDVAIVALDKPVQLTSLPETARQPGLGPFTATGGVKQGYLWELPTSLAAALRDVLKESWPSVAKGQVDAESRPDLGGAARHELYDFLEAQGFRFPTWLVTDYLLSMAAKPFVLLSGISGTGKTKLAQLVADYLAPPDPTSATTGDMPDPGPDAFVHRVGLSTFRYGVTVPRQAAGLFPDVQPGQGLDVTIEADSFSGTARFYNVGFTSAEREVLTVRWHKDAKAWIGGNAREGDYLVMRVTQGARPRVHITVVKPERRVIAGPNPRVAFMSVRADWTDNRAMLGYYNPLTERYMGTPLLRLLLHAARDEQPHFAILDEMNLAQVEYYFSDFLSAMESGTEMLLHSAGDSVFAEIDGEDIQIPERLPVPSNVIFTGTVNIDETTYMFSSKVLDRANVIEFHDVDLEGYVGESIREDGYLLASGIDLLQLLNISPARRLDYIELPNDAKSILVEIHAVLAEYHLHFGYRVANEIGRYVNMARSALGGEAMMEALDLQVLQKVLPKLSGNRAKLERPLWKLVCVMHGHEGEPPRLTPDTEALVLQSQALLPRSAVKLERMLDTVREVGFVSYVE